MTYSNSNPSPSLDADQHTSTSAEDQVKNADSEGTEITLETKTGFFFPVVGFTSLSVKLKSKNL